MSRFQRVFEQKSGCSVDRDLDSLLSDIEVEAIDDDFEILTPALSGTGTKSRARRNRAAWIVVYSGASTARPSIRSGTARTQTCAGSERVPSRLIGEAALQSAATAAGHQLSELLEAASRHFSADKVFRRDTGLSEGELDYLASGELDD